MDNHQYDLPKSMEGPPTQEHEEQISELPRKIEEVANKKASTENLAPPAAEPIKEQSPQKEMDFAEDKRALPENPTSLDKPEAQPTSAAHENPMKEDEKDINPDDASDSMPEPDDMPQAKQEAPAKKQKNDDDAGMNPDDDDISGDLDMSDHGDAKEEENLNKNKIR